jgi:ribosome-associated protein
MLVVTERLKIPLDEFQFTFSRSAGPGGQNVNKVNSKATLRWRIGESSSLPADVLDRFRARHGNWITKDGDLLITSQEYRDQPQNIQACLDRLKSLLSSVAQPPRRRIKTKPTRGSQKRRLANKQRRAQTKQQRRSPRDGE